MDYYLESVTEVAQALRTSPAGLDDATARQRLAEYGPNQLADTRQKAWWLLLLSQFTDVMILVLLAATVISALVGETQSAYVILAIVVLNAAVGFA
jgi:Ca2+-transporting ATPase